MKNYSKVSLAIIIFSLLVSCSKEWLEQKQNIKLIVPTTLNDMELLLNEDSFQLDARGNSEIACDDYEFTPDQLNSLYSSADRDIIIWKSMEIPNYGDKQNDEWDLAYSEIQIANIVLEGLAKIERIESNKIQYDRIRGTALYHRAKQHLNIAMTFCDYYDKNTSAAVSGIPLKLTSDISEKIVRSNLEETYSNIISDLREAAALLPIAQSSQTFIAKGGAFGLLARAYLFTDNYIDALSTADSSFKYNSYIENYNKVSGSPTRPFVSLYTKEMHILGDIRKVVSNFSIGRMSKDLYDLYDQNDLRKTLFFKINTDGKPTFRGSYRGLQLFTATATDEILLIKAECSVRLNKIEDAKIALNLLLENRYKTGTFVPVSLTDSKELLDTILKERRKELVCRGLRWQDLKRLNRDPKFAKTLVRIIGDEVFSLPPNDPKYIFPIPQYIKIFTGIE
ncbi:RagB/SusD family nutrient uptake outer membrane protein [Sphingobacterium paramultivorum]|uniref:RagB/SusD family nutrient uptake outer membrane protein n=1 Tax=Sphingobacterium paramultivorum TaxID=2886510 RepID=UPI00129C8D5B|nr:RagB/SusD family nutrient uptake outer membrane protein [Sphingobacterium paramultivorum]